MTTVSTMFPSDPHDSVYPLANSEVSTPSPFGLVDSHHVYIAHPVRRCNLTGIHLVFAGFITCPSAISLRTTVSAHCLAAASRCSAYISTKRTIVLSQEAYVNTVLERFNMESANPATNPMD